MVKSPLVENKFSFKPKRFLQESLVELKKVIWPTRQQVIKMTVIVIAVSTFAGIVIGGLDYLFTKIIGLIIK